MVIAQYCVAVGGQEDRAWWVLESLPSTTSMQWQSAGALQSKLYALPHVAEVSWFSEKARERAVGGQDRSHAV
jgi:hypothetical protein